MIVKKFYDYNKIVCPEYYKWLDRIVVLGADINSGGDKLFMMCSGFAPDDLDLFITHGLHIGTVSSRTDMNLTIFFFRQFLFYRHEQLCRVHIDLLVYNFKRLLRIGWILNREDLGLLRLIC